MVDIGIYNENEVRWSSCRLTMGDISGAEADNPSGALVFFSFLCEVHFTQTLVFYVVNTC
jgi:hypothetical protein